ncbi:hypothetical protein KR032_000604, partial [Drosophila birchii]
MAFRYIFVISALVVMAQESYLSSVDQESDVGVHSSGAPVAGISRGHSAAPQPQRPASGDGGSYGPIGGSQPPHPHGDSALRKSDGHNPLSRATNRPFGGGAHPWRPYGDGIHHGRPY